MRPCQLYCAKLNQRNARTCNCGSVNTEDMEDAELYILFQDLALTLLELMDPHDSDIFVRFELHGENISKISTQFGCSKADARSRLRHARRCFFQLVVLALAPVKPE